MEVDPRWSLGRCFCVFSFSSADQLRTSTTPWLMLEWLPMEPTTGLWSFSASTSVEIATIGLCQCRSCRQTVHSILLRCRIGVWTQTPRFSGPTDRFSAMLTRPAGPRDLTRRTRRTRGPIRFVTSFCGHRSSRPCDGTRKHQGTQASKTRWHLSQMLFAVLKLLNLSINLSW